MSNDIPEGSLRPDYPGSALLNNKATLQDVHTVASTIKSGTEYAAKEIIRNPVVRKFIPKAIRGLAIFGLVIGGIKANNHLETPQLPKASASISMPFKPPKTEVAVVPYSGVSFGNPEMDKAASSVGITLETYFQPAIPEKTLVNLNALGEWSDDPNFKPELLPIFAPSVLHHRNLIYQLSDEFKINPNLIAAFMSIESGGNHQAVSVVGAQGLFQVMPFHFDEDFAKQKITDPAAKIRYMQNPVNNGRKGMAFFVNQCLPGARKLPGLEQIAKENPYDARIIARAMMMYNAGVTGGGLPWDDLTIETQTYADFGLMFALDAQIAQELRLSGKSNAEIVQIMSSKESDARNFALMVYLSDFRRKHGRFYNYDDKTQLKSQLSKIIPTLSPEENSKILGLKSKDLVDNYYAYYKNPSYEWKTGPGGRQTINSGLAYLYSQPEVIGKNVTNNWSNPQTNRP